MLSLARRSGGLFAFPVACLIEAEVCLSGVLDGGVFVLLECAVLAPVFGALVIFATRLPFEFEGGCFGGLSSRSLD